MVRPAAPVLARMSAPSLSLVLHAFLTGKSLLRACPKRGLGLGRPAAGQT